MSASIISAEKVSFVDQTDVLTCYANLPALQIFTDYDNLLLSCIL